MYHFCTITTADHLYKTLALYDSIMAIDSAAYMHVLCIDALPASLPQGNITFYTPDRLSHIPFAKAIISKYSSSQDKLRWSLKPVFLHYLLDEKTEKAVYADNDMYFFDDYVFLFDLLDTYDFLLTPHHYPRDPTKEQNWLEANFKAGLYNAGFIGVGKTAIPHLQWWAGCCAYRCEKNLLRGTFDDQKYLDLIPVMDDKAHIIRHKGCNVAEWNKATISRSEKNGKIFLDEKYPLVFVHFNGTTIQAIKKGEEPLLKNSLSIYLHNLKQHKQDIKTEDLYRPLSLIDRLKYRIWKIATDASL
jgi:hypothetical protein